MDLPLDIRTRGRTAKSVELELVGEIVEADLALLGASRGSAAPPIKRLRDTHHALARVLASGASCADASAITGYSPSRISILQADPQFQELLAHYRGQSSEVVADFRNRMAGMGLDALQELQHRLEEDPDGFSSQLLLELTKVMADRTGHAPAGKGGTAVQVNVNLGERMAKARERTAALRAESGNE